jgi:hypothetical protein
LPPRRHVEPIVPCRHAEIAATTESTSSALAISDDQNLLSDLNMPSSKDSNTSRRCALLVFLSNRYKCCYHGVRSRLTHFEMPALQILRCILRLTSLQKNKKQNTHDADCRLRRMNEIAATMLSPYQSRFPFLFYAVYDIPKIVEDVG